MKIYFGGSISGGREDSAIYAQIVGYLRTYGEILTEHVADVNLTDQSEGTDVEVYEEDMAWVRESDVMVAEVSIPSLGVGYELGQAEAMGKRVICLFREGASKKLSKMISGNSYMEVVRYTEVEELKEIFNEKLSV